MTQVVLTTLSFHSEGQSPRRFIVPDSSKAEAREMPDPKEDFSMAVSQMTSDQAAVAPIDLLGVDG